MDNGMPMQTVRAAPARLALRLLLVGWAALIFALSSRSQLPHLANMPPELQSVAGHFTVYAVLAALVWAVLPPSRPPLLRFAVAFLAAAIYGLSDEWHQSFVPGRDPDVFDLAIDAAGALSALAVIAIATRLRGNSGK